MKTTITPEEYALLVEELMKENPNQKLVRQLMVKSGLPYSKDPIHQMGQILESIDKQISKTKETTVVSI